MYEASGSGRTVLIVSPDPQLRAEVESAMSSWRQPLRVVQESDPRRGPEAARTRPPALILVEMTPDLRQLRRLVQELAVAAPATPVAAVFRLDLFGPGVSEAAILIEAVRTGVRDFLRRPISGVDLQQMLERILAPAKATPRHSGRVLAFISNKGGVGKSTTAVNTACALALRYPDQVLLVDASLQLGVCASMLDLQPRTSLVDASRERERLDETLLRQLSVGHSSGLHLLAAPADAVQAAEVDDETISRVLTMARRTYRFVIVDTFPLLDRVALGVLDASDRIYLMLENVVPTLQGGARLLNVLQQLDVPAARIRVVLNRQQSAPGSLSLQQVANRLQRTIDFVLPYDRRLLTAANIGRPYMLRPARFARLTREFRGLVRDAESTSAVEEAPPPAPRPAGEVPAFPVELASPGAPDLAHATRPQVAADPQEALR